jgi:hypothetical protein
LAVATPADQFKAVDDDSRRHGLPEMKFELGEITQNLQQKVGVVEVRHVADVVTASHSDESWPRSENEDRVRAALLGDSFQLVKWVFHGFLRCDHEAPCT